MADKLPLIGRVLGIVLGLIGVVLFIMVDDYDYNQLKNKIIILILDNQAWIKSLQLNMDAAAMDTSFYNRLREKWKYLEDEGLSSCSRRLKIETDIIENVNTTIKASLIWPSLITNEGPVVYPLTHAKNSSSKIIELANPSDQVLLVQAVLLADYPSQQAALDIIEDGAVIDIDSQSLNCFKLQTVSPAVDISKYTINGINSHPATLSFMLKPRGQANITISFTPSDYRTSSTFLLIRYFVISYI